MKVGRNDPCPCGSGKKYKTCCISKPLRIAHRALINEDREWLESNLINDGDILFYGSLAEEFETIPAPVIWKELRRIAESYISIEKDRTRIFHEIVDQTIESLSARDKRFGYAPPFCHKGCCNCCHELVYCTSEESECIHDYSKKNNVAIDYEKLSRQLDYVEFDQNKDHTGITTWNEQVPEDLSCAFLNPVDHGCNIWPVRPFVCRVHLAEGSNNFCSPHNGVENENSRGINYIELSYILSVVFTAHRDSVKKTMGRLLLDLKEK